MFPRRLSSQVATSLLLKNKLMKLLSQYLSWLISGMWHLSLSHRFNHASSTLSQANHCFPILLLTHGACNIAM
ncbi:hypothetical protein EJ08DRAFT_654006 [Tothia fuscella]|uniref:Uncharacterized protein n=1 Tax=Tothia fuscella TaxID=1048955 RepID=A0A9P4NFV1_9PEZI|nr:hypothetical protein EJ08DRAFT_654006 [Tothia fuscella]